MSTRKKAAHVGSSVEDVHEQLRHVFPDINVATRPLPHALARSREGRHLTELMQLRQLVFDRWSFLILNCAIH